MTTLALLAAAIAAIAEWLHARRVRRASRLAFGPAAAPRLWTRAAPPLRALGIGLALWGALVLYHNNPLEAKRIISPKAKQQLLVCLDVSPSMLIEDAGPLGQTTSRSKWAGKLVQGILERVSDEDTRFSLIAFYTSALPMLQTSHDKSVLANLLDGLPMYIAFEPGPTRIEAGIREACDLCKPWARKSTTLIVVSDGDASAPTASYRLPSSIADVLVIGVGDTGKSTMVAGHSSRQDAASLKALAAKLGGRYHDGNRRHVPSTVVQGLSMVTPRAGAALGLREAGLLAFVAGSSVLALVTPALMLFGARHDAPVRVAPSSADETMTRSRVPSGSASSILPTVDAPPTRVRVRTGGLS